MTRGTSTTAATLVVLGVLFLGLMQGQASSEERHSVDLRHSDNLKAIFDAGLRPVRVARLEDEKCDLTSEASLSIILPNERQVEIDVERASFEVLEGNALGEADFFGVTESVPRAVERVKAICRAAGLSDAGLDRVAADLGRLPDPDKRWSQAGRVDGVRVWVTFYPMWFRDPVEAQVWLLLQWKRSAGPLKFLSGPIQPPPGYEGVSMDPPPPALRPTQPTSRNSNPSNP